MWTWTYSGCRRDHIDTKHPGRGGTSARWLTKHSCYNKISAPIFLETSFTTRISFHSPEDQSHNWLVCSTRHGLATSLQQESCSTTIAHSEVSLNSAPRICHIPRSVANTCSLWRILDSLLAAWLTHSPSKARLCSMGVCGTPDAQLLTSKLGNINSSCYPVQIRNRGSGLLLLLIFVSILQLVSIGLPDIVVIAVLFVMFTSPTLWPLLLIETIV
jgi:hypothetical protein